MKKAPTILEAMDDEAVFGPWFKPRKRWFGKARDSWATWKVFLAVLFGLPMTDEQRAVFAKFTGRSDTPVGRFIEAVAICGRRAGKSLVAAMVCAYLAAFVDYTQVLQPGEMGIVMLLASDRRQASVLLGYIFGFFDSIPMLRRMVVSRTKESITLSNNIIVEVHTSSFKAVRGFTVVAAVCDEIAFWSKEDSASPDTEVLSALRPAMLSVPSALLLIISSPYSRSGALWELYRENFGKEAAPVLCWQASTQDMNNTVPAAFIKLAFLRDPQSAKAEYSAQFRDDVAGFLTMELLESCVVHGRTLLPKIAGVDYCAFADPSGGRNDSMTLAIGHLDGEKGVLDCLVERVAPFSPEQVTEEFCAVLKAYGVSALVGDKYAAEWCAEQFQKRGITYTPSERSRAELYLEFLPAVTSGQVELLDHRKMLNQFVNLERRTGRSGKDSVDHLPNAHDDISNSAAGCLVLALENAGDFGVLEMHQSGRLIELLAEGAARAAGVARDIFGRSTENPRNENVGSKELYAHEARMRGLDPAVVNEDMSRKGVWAEPPTPPCANPDLKDANGKSVRCIGKTVRINNFYRCQQCGFQKFVAGQESEVLFAVRDGGYVVRRMK
jgi:hypothetical protein